jgi:glucans biosynthesis protein C
VAYGLFRLMSGENGVAVRSTAMLPNQPPNHRQVIRLALGIAFATFLVRIFQPVGTSVMNMQLCNFSQYIALFVVGIVAYRRDWLLHIPYEFGLGWLRFAIFAGVPWWGLVLYCGGVFHGEPPVKMLGGLHWQSAVNCLWESFFCMGMSLGVLVLFRDKWKIQGNFAKLMTRNAFGAYLFHPLLLIAVTLALGPFQASPLIKFAVTGVIAAVVTFAASEFVFRRIPLLKRIL